jgi:hypothetical protein
LEELEKATPHKCNYPDDADILSHIKWLWQALPEFTHSRTWIKPHQDSAMPYKDLPWPAYLNVMADSLATAAYYNKMGDRNKPLTNPHFPPCSRISLLVNGQQITASDSVWKSIDFETFGGAFKSLAAPSRTNISKLVHGW